jgi:radical SAM superfamily enzyme YgiQ (UPF0313 family)
MSNCIILSGGTWSPLESVKIKRSLGPYRIATSLGSIGYSTVVLEYTEELTIEEIIMFISKHLSDETLWVGFSSTFYWPKRKDSNVNSNTSSNTVEQMYFKPYSEIKQIFEFVKKNSNAKFLYGGSKAPYFLVDNNIDYYVTGNADNSIINLTNHIAKKEDLLYYDKHDGHTIVDSLKYPEPNVKNIPTKWVNHSILKKEGLPIELARGCIFKCKFCNYPLLGKKKGTYLRDFDQIRDEMIETWETHGTETYYLTDDTFNDDNDKLEVLHKVFTNLPFKPKFSCYLRLDLINKYTHQADLLTEMGLIGTYFGLETLQPDSAKAIGKGLHPNKVKDRLYWLSEKWKNKVNVEAGFILGLPYDTMSYFNELINWSLEDGNPIDSIHFFPLMLFHYKQKELEPYSSEFSLNPEIYGYEFKTGNQSHWSLTSQKLTYIMCLNIANKFCELRNNMNKIGGFQMITSLNTGIELQDLYNHTQQEIEQKYDIPKMNTDKINEYKRLVGLYK